MVNKKIPPPLESAVQATILDYLKVNKYLYWRSNNAPVFDARKRAFRHRHKHTPVGLPDIMIVHKGKFLGMEVKREGIKLRLEQANIGASIVMEGGYYEVVHSLDEAIAALAKVFSI